MYISASEGVIWLGLKLTDGKDTDVPTYRHFVQPHESSSLAEFFVPSQNFLLFIEKVSLHYFQTTLKVCTTS